MYFHNYTYGKHFVKFIIKLYMYISMLSSQSWKRTQAAVEAEEGESIK